jgi:hypothetical protein
MIKYGIKDRNSRLRDVGSPLVSIAFPLDSAPYLSKDSLIILFDEMNKDCADIMVQSVPEIKGILKGNIRETVGVKNSKCNVYELLSGCDMRCDIVHSCYGDISIYKYQHEIHVELPKPTSPKIVNLSKALNKYKNPKVLDCTCGPGTLGIAALKAGAEYVVFSDIWHAAVDMTALNLEVNGFPVNINSFNTKGDSLKNGVMAYGKNFKIYCADVNDLKTMLNEKFDVGVVDTFPGVKSAEFIESIKGFCNEVVVV